MKVPAAPAYKSSVKLGDEDSKDQFISEHNKNFQFCKQQPITVT